MKAKARRAQDVADTVFLAEFLALSTASEIQSVHDRFYPDEPLSEDDHARIEAIAAVLAQGPDAPEGLGEIITRARSRRRSS